jgi:hypothetical protein
MKEKRNVYTLLGRKRSKENIWRSKCREENNITRQQMYNVTLRASGLPGIFLYVASYGV